MILYTPTPDFYNDYICHHGVQGQKWGVRNGPPYPLHPKSFSSVIEAVDSNKDRSRPEDFILKKGTTVKRITTNRNETFNQRTYVSEYGGSDYEEMVWDPGPNSELYVVTYEFKKDVLVAGVKEIEKVMSEVFDKKIDFTDRFTKDGWYNKKSISIKYADFMNDPKYKNQRKKIIDILIKDGYDAMLDPVDSTIGIGFNTTAMIVINDCMNKKNVHKLL